MKYYVAAIDQERSYCVIGIYLNQRHGVVIVTDLEKNVAETMVFNLNASIRTEKLRPSTKVTRRPVFNFNLIYAEYPRKEGKTPGFASLMRSVENQKDFDDCMQSAKNYRALVKNDDPKFTKMFSTWANQWRDYVDRITAETQPKLTFEEINSRIVL